MKEVIEGRHAVITGGAQGIGAATVRRLWEAGARVTILDQLRIDDEDAIQCDITSEKAAAKALKAARKRHGPVEILINNVGVMFPGDFVERDFADAKKTLDVNLAAAMRLCHAVLPEMLEANRGIIVNVVSASATVGVPGIAAYAASKWGLFGFTESLIGEVRNRGASVHVAAVLPNFIRTGLFEGAHLTGLGGIIVPQVKSHDVVAKAIVEGAIRRRKPLIMRPRTVRTAPFLRGIYPYRFFLRLSRLLGVARSIKHLSGSPDPSAE